MQPSLSLWNADGKNLNVTFIPTHDSLHILFLLQTLRNAINIAGHKPTDYGQYRNRSLTAGHHLRWLQPIYRLSVGSSFHLSSNKVSISCTFIHIHHSVFHLPQKTSYKNGWQAPATYDGGSNWSVWKLPVGHAWRVLCRYPWFLLHCICTLAVLSPSLLPVDSH